MTKRIERKGESTIVYDDALADQINETWFEPSHWSDSSIVPDGGRGQTIFVNRNDGDWVLRHYFRGGIARRFVADKFWWCGSGRTRSFREWELLRYMTQLNLPVPRAVAARFVRHGVIYTADIITVRIPNARSLSRRLRDGNLSTEIWRKVGEMIARFHRARIDHADLNAHNIQIDSNDNVYLLDFDRGRVRPAPGNWSQHNLERLRRSLRKVSLGSGTHCSKQNWGELSKGYESGLAGATVSKD